MSWICPSMREKRQCRWNGRRNLSAVREMASWSLRGRIINLSIFCLRLLGRVSCEVRRLLKACLDYNKLVELYTERQLTAFDNWLWSSEIDACFLLCLFFILNYYDLFKLIMYEYFVIPLWLISTRIINEPLYFFIVLSISKFFHFLFIAFDMNRA